MPARAAFDVAIAGASIAGCTAARLFALAGARVALVERRPDPAAYKVTCTHQIQSSAVPTIERLGLAPSLEQAGAVRSRAAAWTPYGGWLRFPAGAPPGYGISRRSLDPIVRELAVGTAGVEYFPGQTVIRLLGDRGRVEGVEVQRPDRKRRTLRAKLTVAADGARLDDRSTGPGSRQGAPTQPFRLLRLLARSALAEERGPSLDARSGRRGPSFPTRTASP